MEQRIVQTQSAIADIIRVINTDLGRDVVYLDRASILRDALASAQKQRSGLEAITPSTFFDAGWHAQGAVVSQLSDQLQCILAGADCASTPSRQRSDRDWS